MASRLNPYISYSGNARQAFEFYQTVFGGELVVNTFGEFGASDTADADKIMHAQLETPQGYWLMGADTPSYLEFTPGNTMSVSLSGDDSAELHGFFDQLSGGGTVTTPLEKQMWGDEFGMVTDQFGVAWMVNIGQPQS
ncbi:VOC family protein [Streptomyces sp. SID13031]|uniref:VOC family protein n=1 Tax=Streptomyces sp. SID13031 TaxID=2706046 RepID=UPI0013CC808E|nr:VOC family protein [Streptomyces sp. SID13031]NEA34341.1 VOC family protein [Streptomyces sp. SID13031]